MSCSHHITETALCNRNFKCNFSLTFFSQVLQFIFNNTYILKVRFSLKLLLYMCLDHKGKFYKNWVICPLFQSCFHQLKKLPSLPFSLCCRSIIVSATFLQLLLEHTWLPRWYRILLCEEFQRHSTLDFPMVLVVHRSKATCFTDAGVFYFCYLFSSVRAM